MQLKIVTHFLVAICLLSYCVTTVSAYPSGCYECEEEVWEEVPCDDIPSNNSTEAPPLPYVSTTTTTTKPLTTTTTSTTTTTTEPPTTTTTTPSPVESTTNQNDAFKKCYCECKVGCKEFCRKVVVNPESQKQIIQVSKISEPVAQGRVESTHYHQRELIPPSGYGADQSSYLGSDLKAEPRGPQDDGKAKPYDPQSSSPGNYQPHIAINKLQLEPPTIYNTLSSLPYYSSGSYAFSQVPVKGYTAKPDTHYYTAPATEVYDIPIPYQGGDSNVALPNSIPKQSDYNVLCPGSGSYSSPTPVKNSLTETQLSLSGDINFDGSFDPYLKDFIRGNNSPNYGPYESYPQPHYSMSYR